MRTQVDGELWDLTRPLEKDCALVLCDFESKDGKKVFWHSSAHILGEAIEVQFGSALTIGPPLEDGGFYYDVHSPDRYACFACVRVCVCVFVCVCVVQLSTGVRHISTVRYAFIH